MSSITPLTLSDVGQYSTDFQNILNRAVQIAQIPVTQLQNQDSNVLQEKSLLGTLNTSVADLATSLQSLGTVGSSQALSATSSDATIVSASATGATTPATYSIDSITSLAAAASARSTNGYADATSTLVSANGAMELKVGSQDIPFTLTQNNLTGLRDGINSLGAGVTASILTTPNGDYLSLAANSTGAQTISLIDDPKGAQTQLLTQTNPGANAVFSLNGIPITQSSNLVNSVIPGVTLRLLNTSSTPVTVSLASDPTQLSSALQDFVTNYNALQSQLRAQVGPAGGLLSGNLVVTQLQNMMRQIASYQGAAGLSVRSLADLGVTFNSTGQASFNQNTFSSLSDTQITDAFTFAGSATSGLAAFSSQLQQYSDPVSGLIQTEEAGMTQTDQSLQAQITTLTDRINTMQTNLSQQLATTDSAATLLQDQQQTLSASIQGLNLVLYGRYPNQ